MDSNKGMKMPSFSKKLRKAGLAMKSEKMRCQMQLKQAIIERWSICNFLKDPISQEVLLDILQMATYAISVNNSQPWAFYVVPGVPLDTIRQENLNDLK